MSDWIGVKHNLVTSTKQSYLDTDSPFGLTIGSVFKELDVDQICYTALLQSLCQFLIICPLKK